MSALVFLLAVAAIVAFGRLILFLMADMSGWRLLASAYTSSERFPDCRQAFVSGRMRTVTFHSTLVVGADARGLHLRPIALCRPSHPALLIPWSELSGVRADSVYCPVVRLSIRGAPTVPIELPVTLALWLQQQAPAAVKAFETG